MSTEISNETRKRRRRWITYSLRSLLVLVTILCIMLALETTRVRRFRSIRTSIEQMGGSVFPGYRFDSSGKPKGFSKREVPPWLTSVISEDYFLTIVTINLWDNAPTRATDDNLECIQDATDVTELLLAKNPQLTDRCLEHIDHMRRLRVILLSHTGVKGPGLRHIRGLQNLEGLALDHTDVSDDAVVEHLRDLPKLQWLHLSDTGVTDKALAAVAELTSLESLELRNTDVTDEGLQHLKSLTKLKQLLIGSTRVTEHGRAELQQSLPNCLIESPNVR